MNTNEETMPSSGSPSFTGAANDPKVATGGANAETSIPTAPALETPPNPFLVSGSGTATPTDPFFDTPPVLSGDGAAAAWSPGQLASGELIQAVRAIENKNTGGFTKLLVLFVSLGLFMAAGMAWWNPRMIGMLVVVLLFHEAGHYLAMKTFGYRNVKMFFIPFLGAAVSGRHFNIAGWKKAIVYLAGPVPGIVVALPLMWLGPAWEIDWMFELGAMSLLLNALNLLPIMPLDGGWIMHLTVFSRSPLLELLARIVGIGAMIAFGIFAGSKFLFFIAIPLLISLPTTFRVSKLIRHMRDQPLPQPQVDEIPDDAIKVLNQEMESTALSEVATPQKAALLVQIYESLIVRPPGVLATLAIWFLYGGSFMVALVGGSTMYAMRGIFAGGFFGEGMFDSAAHVVMLDPSDTQFMLGTAQFEESLLAVARFDSASELSANLKQIDESERDRFTHVRIGDVLLATVPKDARPGPGEWAADQEEAYEEDVEFDLNEFQDRMTAMFKPVDPADTWLAPLMRSNQGRAATASPDSPVTRPQPGQPIVHVVSGMHHDSIQLLCRAPSVEIANQVAKDDFQMPGLTADRLYIPNWSPIDPPTEQQIANREILKTLVNGINQESAPKLFEVRNKLYQSQYKGYNDESGEIDTEVAAVRAAKFQSKIRDLEAKYTSDLIAGLEGEEAEVARKYQRFQDALHVHAEKMSRRSIEMEKKRTELGDDFDYADFQDGIEEETYPSMDQFLIDDNGILGFGVLGQRSYPFAAHVSGAVLSENDYQRQMNPQAIDEEWDEQWDEDWEENEYDEQSLTEDDELVEQGEFVSLYIHRATDYTATVSSIIAYLQQKGFTEFSLHYVTPTADFD